MLLSILFSIAHLVPASAEGSLLATVPEDAYTLVHCRDVAALRERAERNDWYRLLGSSHGEPILSELTHEVRHGTHSDPDELLAMARLLEGEVVFFDTGRVAGFVVEAPANPAVLTDLMRGWLPQGDAAARRTLELAGGAVELAAWPDEIEGWAGRAGHFAAFVEHPRVLALYSGDDSAAVVAAVTAGFTGLGGERRSPLVSSYLTSGGGEGGGIELFIDFTPLVGPAEAALKEAVEGALPDPTGLLGLEAGTWLHAHADVFPGTRLEGRGRIHLPQDTLAAELADTFKPLPRTLPADLPGGVWALWALNWDLKLFYQRVRAAYEEAGRGEGLEPVDAGIEAAQGMTGVDPVADVMNQLAGDFAAYFVHPSNEQEPRSDEMEAMLSFGLQVGLIDGAAFLTAFEKLFDTGPLQSVLELEDIEGVDAYVIDEGDGVDGGAAFLPHALTAAPSRHLLRRGIRALLRAEGASLLEGSRMQAAIDENAAACFLWCVELTPWRAYMLPELEGDPLLPPLEDGQPARDPFDSQLVSTARRTPDGFELRLDTR